MQWLSEQTNKSIEEIQDIIDANSSFSYTRVNIGGDFDYENAMRLKVESEDYSGVEISVQSQRHYPLTEQDYSLSHLLGYVGQMTAKEEEKMV